MGSHVDLTTPLSERQRQKTTNRLAPQLAPDEHILFVGACTNFRPMLDRFVITDQRVFGLQGNSVTFVHAASGLSDVRLDRGGRQVVLEQSGSTLVTVKSVPSADFDAIDVAIDATKERSSTPSGTIGAGPSTWVGSSPSKKARDAVKQVSAAGEEPWLIIHPSGFGGMLVAFEGRIVVIKTGGVTSLLAGSFGGVRSATFYLTEITGIEYNSGLLNGVLQVLTASYDGSPNKDFWKGTFESRNADSNDPFTLTNTLPMTKAEYRSFQPQIARLLAKISESRKSSINVVVEAGPSSASMTDELAGLAQLLKDGVLTPDEFARAKAKLIGP